MNSMELVQPFSRDTYPHSATEKRSAPLFCSELTGSVRLAILRARHYLLSEQQRDGSWQGRQSTDASLPSLLIFWLAFTERERDELAQRCAARVLDLQLPGGGWSRSIDGSVDLSTSVQAYFALKLVGVDPSSDGMARARAAIRRYGGADATDATTRYLLAMFGQTSYEVCPPVQADTKPPNVDSALIGPVAIIASRQLTQNIGIERGVRELFLQHPSEWKAIDLSLRRSGAAPIARRLTSIASRWMQRRSWKPRLRATTQLEEQLQRCCASDPLRKLRFEELVWRMFALKAMGFDYNSYELKACEEQLDSMLFDDKDANTVLPQPATAAGEDTALVARSLLESGTTWDHAAIVRAVRNLFEALEEIGPSLPRLADFCNWLMVAQYRDVTAADSGLPPDMELYWDSFEDESTEAAAADADIHRLVANSVQQLLLRQNPDGGWGEQGIDCAKRPISSLTMTCRVLDALRAIEKRDAGEARKRAAAFLRDAQCADGGWAGDAESRKVAATACALRGLLAAGVAIDDDEFIAGVNWLIIQQHRGGGWSEGALSGEINADDTASITLTALVLLVLVDAGHATHATVRRAVTFLIDSQNDDGRWTDSSFFDWDAESQRYFQNELHATAVPLLALSRWAVAALSDQSDTEHEIQLRLVGTSAEH